MEEKTVQVIRYRDHDGSWTYLASIGQDKSGSDYCDECYSIEDAMDFSNSNLTEIKNAFLMFQEENAGNECQIVKITIKVEQLTSPDGEYHELLKFRALKKLSSEDIRALGLESIMVYMKTKYG